MTAGGGGPRPDPLSLPLPGRILGLVPEGSAGRAAVGHACACCASVDGIWGPVYHPAEALWWRGRCGRLAYPGNDFEGWLCLGCLDSLGEHRGQFDDPEFEPCPVCHVGGGDWPYGIRRGPNLADVLRLWDAALAGG